MALWLPVNGLFRDPTTRNSAPTLGSPVARGQKEREHSRRQENDSKSTSAPISLLPAPAHSCRGLQEWNVLALWSPYQGLCIDPPEPCWQPWKETALQPRPEQRVGKGTPGYQLACYMMLWLHLTPSFFTASFSLQLSSMAFFSLLPSTTQLFCNVDQIKKKKTKRKELDTTERQSMHAFTQTLT